MALRKRISSIKIQKAETRLFAMEVIDTRYGKKVNYGGELNPLNQIELKMQVELCKKLIGEYNRILTEADKKSIEIKEAEQSLGDMFTRVLAGGVSIFGVNSNEVEELGGTKKSDRKKSEKYNHNNTIIQK